MSKAQFRILMLLTVVSGLMGAGLSEALFRGGSALAAERGGPPKALLVGGRSLILTDGMPYLSEGCVMVPARAIFEWLGATVTYEAATQRVRASLGTTVITLYPGQKRAWVDGRTVVLDAPVVTTETIAYPGALSVFSPGAASRTFVPLRFACETLGADVAWDAASETATITHQGRVGTLFVFSPNKWTKLHEAAAAGKPTLVRALLRRGADVNEMATLGMTALHLAAHSGHTETAKVLLEHAADMNAKDSFSMTPLHFAASGRYAETARLLLDHGADVNAQDALFGWMPIHVAVQEDDVESTKLLLAHNANVNVRDGDGKTPLYWAAVKGHTELARVLLEHGAGVNVKDKDCVSPLYWAAMKGHTELAKLLVVWGADVNTRDSQFGLTPLHLAAGAGDSETVRLLLERGADVKARDDEYGSTPLHCAAGKGRTESAKLLLERNADVNALDSFGYTPLDWATMEAHTGTAVLLRMYGGR